MKPSLILNTMFKIAQGIFLEIRRKSRHIGRVDVRGCQTQSKQGPFGETDKIYAGYITFTTFAKFIR